MPERLAPMRSYTKKDGTCPTCGQTVPLHRNRIATHGWPTCAGTGEKPMGGGSDV